MSDTNRKLPVRKTGLLLCLGIVVVVLAGAGCTGRFPAPGLHREPRYTSRRHNRSRSNARWNPELRPVNPGSRDRTPAILRFIRRWIT